MNKLEPKLDYSLIPSNFSFKSNQPEDTNPGFYLE